jgi:DNA-binding transcriptional LysR family regulator
VTSIRELACTPLVTRESGSGTREVFDVAVRRALAADVIRTNKSGTIEGTAHIEPSTPTETPPPALELPTTAAVRAAVIAGAGPAVLSQLAVADDLAAGRLRVIEVDGLDLRRRFHAVWSGTSQPRPGPVRDLITVAVRSVIASDRTGT